MPEPSYPPISDYALISDCHCTALVSRSGSVDWCCMPRMDSDSCFGRLLDWNKGGYSLLCPEGEHTVTRRYLPGTMVLETSFATAHGQVRLYDFFAMPPQTGSHRHIRILEGVAGSVRMQAEVCPRFDYGEIIPMVQPAAEGGYTAVGGNKGLLVRSDLPMQLLPQHGLAAGFELAAGQRMYIMVSFFPPEDMDKATQEAPGLEAADHSLELTRQWWTGWAAQLRGPVTPQEPDPPTLQSTLVLKALMYEPTGAIAAAPTTSLPESIGAERNWDYRFSWVRDSVFAIRALYALGVEDEAARFMQFIQRCSAGSADQLQIMYAVDGKRRLTEIELDWLDGYRGSRPVRIGNRAFRQNQLDVFGEIMEIAWLSYLGGNAIDSHYWDFLCSVVRTVSVKWKEQDHGIWEFRGRPRHYVHSKVLCWAALDRGIRLAQASGLDAPLDEWTGTRDEIRAVIETSGYDARRGIFVQAFDSNHLDASLLLIPRTGFIAYDDPRMLRTTDAICEGLADGDLLARYTSPDNLSGREGVFLPCTFWLVACLARQGRLDEARRYYASAMTCANDLGLLSEEYDAGERAMLGNFPQALTHVSQIVARLAILGLPAGPQ